MQAREVVDRARAGGQRDRHRAVGVELLDVRAQRHALAPRDRAQPLEVLVAEGDRLDVDVERVDVAPPRPARRPRPSSRRRRSPAGPRGRTARSTAVGAELAREPHRAQLALAREAVAGLGLERRRARAASISRADARAPARAPRRRSPRRARAPTPRSRRRARAISSYGTPVTFCSYSSARQPANGRCVWQSTKPGTTAQPRRVDHHVGAGVVLERRDHAVAHRRPSRARAAGRAVGAGRAGRPRAGAGPARRRGATLLIGIGIRTPSRSAASSASG